ncbi:MAG: nucleoside-diphosphate kinase [Actinomycetota bacterium]
MSDRTLVLLKPDAVERKLAGTIIARLEAKNLDIVAMELRTLDHELLARHYEEHVDKPFYPDLVEFMSRGPVVAMVVEGPEDTWEVVRAMMGATNPRSAAPGTIRGDLGILFTENLVHGSDSLASAEREIGIFFPDL